MLHTETVRRGNTFVNSTIHHTRLRSNPHWPARRKLKGTWKEFLTQIRIKFLINAITAAGQLWRDKASSADIAREGDAFIATANMPKYAHRVRTPARTHP